MSLATWTTWFTNITGDYTLKKIVYDGTNTAASTDRTTDRAVIKLALEQVGDSPSNLETLAALFSEVEHPDTPTTPENAPQLICSRSRCTYHGQGATILTLIFTIRRWFDDISTKTGNNIAWDTWFNAIVDDSGNPGTPLWTLDKILGDSNYTATSNNTYTKTVVHMLLSGVDDNPNLLRTIAEKFDDTTNHWSGATIPINYHPQSIDGSVKLAVTASRFRFIGNGKGILTLFFTQVDAGIEWRIPLPSPWVVGHSQIKQVWIPTPSAGVTVADGALIAIDVKGNPAGHVAMRYIIREFYEVTEENDTDGTFNPDFDDGSIGTQGTKFGLANCVFMGYDFVTYKLSESNYYTRRKRKYAYAKWIGNTAGSINIGTVHPLSSIGRFNDSGTWKYKIGTIS